MSLGRGNSLAYACIVKHVEPKLTPALQRLLETSLRLETTNNRQLAETLECSGETIKSGFRRLAVLLQTHSRSESLLKAIRHGWIVPFPRNSRGKGGDQ